MALPTIWLVNRDDGGRNSARPNVASVGIDPGEAHDVLEITPAFDVVDEDFDPMGESPVMYLEPAASLSPPETVVVVVGTMPEDVIATARGSYRRSVPNGECQFNGVPAGADVTVVNVANGRSIRCTTSTRSDGDAATLVMSPFQFKRIASVTAAPIHVEIRQ